MGVGRSRPGQASSKPSDPGNTAPRFNPFPPPQAQSIPLPWLLRVGDRKSSTAPHRPTHGKKKGDPEAAGAAMKKERISLRSLQNRLQHLADEFLLRFGKLADLLNLALQLGSRATFATWLGFLDEFSDRNPQCLGKRAKKRKRDSTATDFVGSNRGLVESEKLAQIALCQSPRFAKSGYALAKDFEEH